MAQESSGLFSIEGALLKRGSICFHLLVLLLPPLLAQQSRLRPIYINHTIH